MQNVHFCSACGAVYPKGTENQLCGSCKIELIDSGYSEESWYKLSRQEREEIKTVVGPKALQAEREKRERIEKEKQAFARSFNEYYEYDVVTVFNEGHGRIDREAMMNILMTHARQGWKLHSVYSNELGKNALQVMGFGINATACEDVLIFERRVQDLQD